MPESKPNPIPGVQPSPPAPASPVDGARPEPAAPTLTDATRREVLQQGGRSLLTATVGGSLGLGMGLGLGASPALAFDWFGLAGKSMPDAAGVVKFLQGEAFANKRPLKIGGRVPPGAFVTVAPEGKLIISIIGGGVFTLFGGSQLEIVMGRMRQGLLNLLAGALLLVAPKGGRYLVGGPDASFGIKGTVVFRQVFNAHNRSARAMEKTVQVPRQIDSYFCTCHGAVDYLTPNADQTFFSDKAEYHRSFYLQGGQSRRLEKAPMINHGDADIRELVSHQDGPKHDLSWLKH